MAEEEAGQETNLGAYSPVDYMSITSFPRLPEDDTGSTDNVLRYRKDDDSSLCDPDTTDPDLFLKSARLQRLPSSSSEMGSQEMSPLRVTNKDPFSSDCACRQDGLTVIITACLTFATGVTVALIMQIYFGDPQIFHQGAVVTDVAHCSTVGTEILNRDGSSVDAAIVSALCLGIIHPHSSGIGGGGVMLVHDIRKNESFIIDFRETAPAEVEEQMFVHNWEDKPGLLVAVPGMIQGLHQAHQLYGRISWSELMAAAAKVAQDGFNVTQELEGLSEKDEPTMVNKVTKEINLSGNNMWCSLPSSRALLIPYSFYLQSLKIALALASSLSDPFFNSTVTQLIEQMLSKSEAKILHQLINDSAAFPPAHYLPFYSLETGSSASQVHVFGPDDFIVSVVSSLNRPFGSGIMTASGVLLNSQMLDFSWSNKAQDNSTANLRNSIQAGKRPVSFLLPTIVRPLRGMCGTYLSLGASGGTNTLSSLTEVLLNIFSFRKHLNESLALGRFYPQLQPNVLLVENEFPEEEVEFLAERGHTVMREEIHSLVHVARRINDFITGAKDPRSSDAAAAVIL
ncbi:glutathione hydrolase 7 [Chiloscyllium plagiosum]|uniref:glutathione hydrolase 7 n=1 Tax=Chiloscyllium plagiosum TaxID=36176 RepID=UPI001CB816CB|nr:glutathione hydrolase 7 [Chiloscyllium plagiosum]